MKLLNKLITLLLFCLLFTEVLSQEQTNIQTKEDSLLAKSFYNVFDFTQLINYNSAEVLDSLIYIPSVGDKWKLAYYYNNDLSLNYFTSSYPKNSVWQVYEKHTNSYNSEGNLETVLWEWYNASLGVWVTEAKDVYDYDSLENRISDLHQIFNGHEFENLRKIENYFEGTKLVVSINKRWENSIWVNSSKSNYTYTSNGLQLSRLFQKFVDNQWVNAYLTYCKYDEDYNVVTILPRIWQEQNWVDIALSSLEYDLNNNLVREKWQMSVNNKWENRERVFYEYIDNNLIHLFGEEWVNGQWVPGDVPLPVTNPDGILYAYIVKEIFLYYGNPTSVKNENNLVDEFVLYQNYPNPFNPSTTLSYRLKESGYVRLVVYDVKGELVTELINEYQSAGYYEKIFDAKAMNLSSGVYLFRIEVKNENNIPVFSDMRKSILLK